MTEATHAGAASVPRRILQQVQKQLTRERDIASLSMFRVLFGLVVLGSSVRFLAKGWVEQLLLVPSFHFSYFGMDFILPWPGAWMYVHYACMALFALGLCLGLFYRVCSVGLLLTFGYAELIDRSLYLNHYYLVTLLAALLCVLPAGRAYALDVLFRPERALSRIPNWVLLALRLQVGVVYVFAGFAKLNADWLLRAQPLRLWLASWSDLPLVGWWLALPAVAYLASWLGAVFDLGIVPLLFLRRTRVWAFASLVAFHLTTGLLFPIGIFPWLMIASATVWLQAGWPLRLVGRGWPQVANTSVGRSWSPRRVLSGLVAVHCLLQVLLPIRQHLLSESAWTSQGFDFAWKVMLVEKVGRVTFRVRERHSQVVTRVEPQSFLAPFQVTAMARDPQLIRQAALELAGRFRDKGREVAVYADASASLNGRSARRMIDPDVDLTGPLPSGWILPLTPRARELPLASAR